MRVYQCIHKYPPHIPCLEKKYGIETGNFSFNELRDIVLHDGYASAYVLKPALEGNDDIVFFTLWNYERLQHRWAEEHGLKTKDLDEIKLAQIEYFHPDVFYNHSPRYDNNFVDKLEGYRGLTRVCWDAIATEYPWLHEKYDLRFTFFKPFLEYWRSKGLASGLLTPAIDPSWAKYLEDERPIDVLFYGQVNNEFFSGRNQLIARLLEWNTGKPYKVHVHLQGLDRMIPLLNVKGLRRLTLWRSQVPKIIRDHALPPVYGAELYQAIGRARIVINASGDYNGLYKDNMRNYEAVGCGALLIAQDGISPDALTPGKDFLCFRNAAELFHQIEYVLSMPDQGREMAKNARMKLLAACSKEVQWETFQKLIGLQPS